MSQQREQRARMLDPTKSITFIGAGNMASALIHGLLQSGVSAGKIRIIEKTETRLQHWKEKGVHATKNIREGCSQTDLIFLCVKPHAMQEVLESCRPFVGQQSVLVSIAAGVRLKTIRHWLQLDSKQYPELIRCMPNTPALVGQGVTGAYAPEGTSIHKKQMVESILSCCGEVVWLGQESDLDAVTALSGSGPAYIFQFMQAMISAGTGLGLSAGCAKNLVLHMLNGATQMARPADINLLELEQQIRTPGGTTDAACSVLAARDFQRTIIDAVSAAHRRSVELSEMHGT